MSKLSLEVGWPGWFAGLLAGLILGGSLAVLFGLPPSQPAVPVLLLAFVCGSVRFAVGLKNPVSASPIPELSILLGLPLIGAAALFFALSKLTTIAPWEELFFDLGVTTIGVLFTVFLVDRVLEYERKSQWVGVDKFAIGDLNNAAAGVLTRIVAMNPDWKPPGMVYDLSPESSIGEINEEYIEFVEARVIEQLATRLSEFDDLQWHGLSAALTQIVQEFEHVLWVYGDRLRPEFVEKIHQIRTGAGGAQSLIGLMTTTPYIDSSYVASPLHLLAIETIALMRICQPLLRRANKRRRYRRELLAHRRLR